MEQSLALLLHHASITPLLPVRACVPGCRGYTACHVAAQYGQTAAIHHLALKWNADMDSLDSDGRSPLHWAAYKGFAGGPFGWCLLCGRRAGNGRGAGRGRSLWGREWIVY